MTKTKASNTSPHFVLNLDRSYSETVTLGWKAGDDYQSQDIPVEFYVKPLDQQAKELEQYGEAHPQKAAVAHYPQLFVVLKSVDLSSLNLMSGGKKVPEKLWLDSVILDPQLSSCIYNKYLETNSGNAPAAT